MKTKLVLNALTSYEREQVIDIAKKYKTPPTVEDIILDLKEKIHDYNEDDIRTIIRKLRTSLIIKRIK